MCGIAGICAQRREALPDLAARLRVMNRIQEHRGPDGSGIWTHHALPVGFAHRRLSIIDLGTGAQPMADEGGNVICFNGEIYNYLELREELRGFPFRTTSDTEVILAAYRRWGAECLAHLRGMFAFALWDEQREEMFCARDRFGIKPFAFALVGGTFYFASEAKALLPFLPAVSTNPDALKDYLVFQFTLGGKTLFTGVEELPAAHYLVVKDGAARRAQYWEVYYEPDFDHTERYFQTRLRTLLEESARLHLRSDVPIGCSLSGGLDSSVVSSLAAAACGGEALLGFTGRFDLGPLFDESPYARALADRWRIPLEVIDITPADFVESMPRLIRQLDYPVAGPGAFPQYLVSRAASRRRKVLLGGQGGDEIFGGYVRYLVAYFEQCIKGAIEGTLHRGTFIVTYESIIPNLVALRTYKPLLQEFWREGLFEDLDRRYYRLVNRGLGLGEAVVWEALGDYAPFETFRAIFAGRNVGKESYFDKMTHFDFKTLLPALLHVEDRMSMAHGIESRVPLLDHPLVEFAASMPSNVKFQDGTLKRVLKRAAGDLLPEAVAGRTDKMGFPVPLAEWMQGGIRDFVEDVFRSARAGTRPYVNRDAILRGMDREPRFGRSLWGLLSLELWHQQFHDQQWRYPAMLKEEGAS